jgi:hypothetical protein
LICDQWVCARSLWVMRVEFVMFVNVRFQVKADFGHALCHVSKVPIAEVQ